MKAITDFAATREHIAYAVRVFAEGEQQERIELAAIRNRWAEETAAKAWLNKKVDYWLRYAEGNGGDHESVCIKYETLNQTNLSWYEARHKDARQLLARFDCAVGTCEATEVILSDDDLTLLSVSLQSALGG